jgi:hypothetical protein
MSKSAEWAARDEEESLRAALRKKGRKIRRAQRRNCLRMTVWRLLRFLHLRRA